MFDFHSAIQDALADFSRFKSEMSTVSDPKEISAELVKSVQTTTKQGCQALGIAGTFGITIPQEVKEEVSGILDYFLHDQDGMEKVSALI